MVGRLDVNIVIHLGLPDTQERKVLYLLFHLFYSKHCEGILVVVFHETCETLSL